MEAGGAATASVGIFVFEGVELLDLAGPYEVFTTASRLCRRANPGAPDRFRVFTVGRTGAAVRVHAGLLVSADHAFRGCPDVDVLVVPGGVVDDELSLAETVAWIAATAACSRITASVCTGAFFLAAAGLLGGRRATTHWEDVPGLRSRWPDVIVEEGVRWVDEGGVVTAAGISAGIDMSLHLVERLADRELALRTARQMDYSWVEEDRTTV
jgi:transcriptional regulator GlxA family with amidase domain